MKRNFFAYIILIFILISFFRYIQRAPKRNYSDFHVLYITAQRIIRGEEIYTFKSEVSYFKYPVFYAFLISPLGYLSEFQAALIWHGLNWFFLILIFYCWLKIINSQKWKLVSLLTFIFSFRFILENLDQGQANISFMAFTSIGLYFYFRDRKTLGALFLSLSILSKYLSLFLLPFFLIKREYKVFIQIILFLILLYFSPVIVSGWEQMFNYAYSNIKFLFTSSLDRYSITCYPNQSLLACLRRLFSANQWYPTQVVVLPDPIINWLFFTLGITLIIFAYLPRVGILNLALVSILIALLNPNGWKNSFIWLLIPAMILIYHIFEEKISDKLLIGLFISAFIFTSLTSEFFVYRWAGDWFEIHSFITLGALILYLAVLRLRNISD